MMMSKIMKSKIMKNKNKKVKAYRHLVWNNNDNDSNNETKNE